MKYSFKEAKLGKNFCRKQIAKVRRLVGASTSFTVVGMPAMGISIFLRYLATKKFAYFVHIDIYELVVPTTLELLKLLLKELGGGVTTKGYGNLLEDCKRQLEWLVEKEKRVVIIFNRFDQLQKGFNANFLGNLRVLRDVDKEKIVMVFLANKPLAELAPDAISGGNLNMYSTSLYLTPYKNRDLLRLLMLNAPGLAQSNVVLKKALVLSGGHYQLLNLLLKSERLSIPLFDPFIRTQLKAIYDNLNYQQQRQTKAIAQNKKVSSVDKLILDTGIVKSRKSGFEFFTPLFSEFINSSLPLKLPVKEQKLFNLLKLNLGKVVLKDEIFNVIWGEDNEEASDWALNALVYRLRRNLNMLKSEFVIESQKKVGYSLSRV